MFQSKVLLLQCTVQQAFTKDSPQIYLFCTACHKLKTAAEDQKSPATHHKKKMMTCPGCLRMYVAPFCYPGKHKPHSTIPDLLTWENFLLPSDLVIYLILTLQMQYVSQTLPGILSCNHIRKLTYISREREGNVSLPCQLCPDVPDRCGANGRQTNSNATSSQKI